MRNAYQSKLSLRVHKYVSQVKDLESLGMLAINNKTHTSFKRWIVATLLDMHFDDTLRTNITPCLIDTIT